MKTNYFTPKSVSLLFALLSFLPFISNAQLFVTTANKVGIGTSTPFSKFEVSAGDINVLTTTNAYMIGSANMLWHNNKTACIYVGGAGSSSSTGSQNTFVGSAAGAVNTSGGSHTFLGYRAGYSNATASYNVFIGNSSGQANVSGQYNAFLGMNSGYVNTASYNTFVGHNSGLSNTSGNQNVFMGYISGYTNTTGYFNTFIGDASGYANTVGDYNTYVGFQAGDANTTGEYNTFIGDNAGDTHAACSTSTFIGYNTDADANSYTNATAIGNGALVLGSSRVELGNATVDVFTTTGHYYTGSDGRFKFNIQENVRGLEFIKRLRPVTYQMNTHAVDSFIRQNMPHEEFSDSLGLGQIVDNTDFATSTNKVHSGFIAQEVEQAAIDCGFISSIVHIPDHSTDHYSVAYAEFVVPLIKAVQEQQEQIEELNDLIRECCAAPKSLNIQEEGTQQEQNLRNGATQVIELNYSENVILYQNIPNPFGDETTINYYLPKTVSNATMIFYNDMGQSIKEYVLENTGNASVILKTSELTTGVYSYSLIVDGKTVDTKRMVKK